MDILKQGIALLPEREKKMIFEQIVIFNATMNQVSGKNNDDYEKIVIDNIEKSVTENPLMINSFINNTCNILLSYANPAGIDKSIDNREFMKVFLAEKSNEGLIEKISDYKNNYRFNKEEMLNLYNIFCDTVVKYILEHLSI